MANTQSSDIKIDTLYVQEVMDQSSEAYKNLLLLALKNCTDLSRVGALVDKAIKNYLTSKKIILHESFRGIAYMSAMARENDRSLLGILYMGPKEQKDLVRRIVKDIAVDQVKDFKILDPIRKAAEFKVMLYVDNSASNIKNAPGYLMTFRKKAVNSEGGLSYTLEAKYISGDSEYEEPYFLFREQTLVWEEVSGDLATCVEKIISLSPIPSKNKGLASRKHTTIRELFHVENDAESAALMNEAFNDVYSQLENGLNGSTFGKESTKDVKSDSSDKSIDNKYHENKKTDDKKDTGKKEKKKPASKTYKIIKCKEPVLNYKTENSKLMYMVTDNGRGNEIYIPVVVSNEDSLIYVDGSTYEKYKSFIKKKIVLK